VSPAPSEAQTRAPLEELATVRVAPPPGNAMAEPAPAASPPINTLAEPAPVPPPESTRALPLPPPPKPDLPRPATGQAPSEGQLADAADAAVTGASQTEETVDPADDVEGTGGPFEPLFAKLPAWRGTPGQVLLHYTASAAGGPATAMHLVRQLKAAGFSVEARAVQFPIAGNSIRYFFPEDREQAEALRTSLEGQMPGGAPLSVMDFSSFDPKPQEGHLEIWLRS
jgi:hypothetical protein